MHTAINIKYCLSQYFSSNSSMEYSGSSSSIKSYFTVQLFKIISFENFFTVIPFHLIAILIFVVSVYIFISSKVSPATYGTFTVELFLSALCLSKSESDEYSTSVRVCLSISLPYKLYSTE